MTLSVQGNVVEESTVTPIEGIRVEAWDKDFGTDDYLGSAISGPNGEFIISFDESMFEDYANVLVNGKTGSRSLLLTDSIPYLKDYLNTEHPMPDNIESPLICATGKSLGRRLTGSELGLICSNYKKKIFPNILNNNDVSEEDKQTTEPPVKLRR